jgi:hypothetical protein
MLNVNSQPSPPVALVLDRRSAGLIVILTILACVGTSHAVETANLQALKPGEPIDYAPLAFRPEVWKSK